MLPTRNYVAIDPAITQRPTSTALLTIDSEDRYPNKTAARTGTISPYDFSINLPASLMNGFFTRLAVSEIVFPWAIPNVGPKTNKIIVKWNVFPAPAINTAIITISNGFYTPAQLAAEIQLTVRAVDPALATFFITYSGTAAGNNPPLFEYGSGAGNVSVGFAPMTPLTADYPYSDQARQLFDVLGFGTLNETVEGNAFGGFTFAQATRYVDIVCQQLVNNQALKDASSQKTSRDALCRVYIVDPANIQSTTSPASSTFCPPGCVPTTIYRNFSLPKQIQWLPNQPIVGSLKFEVYDDEGDILSMSDVLSSGIPPTGLNWSMTLLVTEN